MLTKRQLSLELSVLIARMNWSESYQAGKWLIFLRELKTSNILPDERKRIRVSPNRLGVLFLYSWTLCIKASAWIHVFVQEVEKKEACCEKNEESWRSERWERWGEMRNCRRGNFKQQQHVAAVTYCNVFDRVWWRLWPAAKNSSCGNACVNTVSSEVWKRHSWKLKRFLFVMWTYLFFIFCQWPSCTLVNMSFTLCLECVSFEYDGVLVELFPARQWKSQLEALSVRLQLRRSVQKNPLRGSN